MGMKKNEGQLFRLHGSIDMRVVESPSKEWVSGVRLILNRDINISSWRDVWFEGYHGI